MSKRILIINVNWLGDVLFSTPFIRAVREAYPDAVIASLVHPRCREILEDNPRLNKIIIYDEEGAHKSLVGKLALVRNLRRERFDTAFLLHRSFTKAAIAYLAGAKERIGYPSKGRAALLTKVIEEPPENLHKIDRFLNIAASCGIEARDRSCEFFIKESHRKSADEFLKASGVSGTDRIIALCPGGNWDPKRWPKENFAKAADALAVSSGARIVITGGGREAGLAEEIKQLMKSPAIIAAGRTTLKELGAIFERSSLVIANDTGSMHIAVAIGARTIALFGPTSPALTGPAGRGKYSVISKYDECDIPCYDVTCKDNRCMAAIKVEDVSAEAKALLR